MLNKIDMPDCKESEEVIMKDLKEIPFIAYNCITSPNTCQQLCLHFA